MTSGDSIIFSICLQYSLAQAEGVDSLRPRRRVGDISNRVSD